MVINDGMRVYSIFQCGVMVDFMDMDDCCFTCMGENMEFSVPRTTCLLHEEMQIPSENASAQ